MESAKRRVPKVAPVTGDGVRYEVVYGARSHGFDQNGGIIRAVSLGDGSELWTLVVYRTEYDQREEKDVQDVYIVGMSLEEGGRSLLVENERKKRFSVSLADRTVRALP